MPGDTHATDGTGEMADASLHIGVDARELLGRPTGVGRFLKSVLHAWPEGADRFTMYVPSYVPESVRALGPRFSWVELPAARAGTWWEQWHLPRQLRRDRPDVLFAPGYTAPLHSPCPTVLAIHDVSFFAHPEWFGWREGMRRRWITRRAAERAAAVLTVSEFSGHEINRWLEIPTDRIYVAPHGAPAVDAAAEADRTRPIVLFVGSLFNRRRLPEMIRGFAHAAKHVPDAELVMVGDNRTYPHLDPISLAREAGIADRVTWLDYVSDDELERAYRTAQLFVFLSDYEGFGLTPLEAIAHRLPPVLLDTPLSREAFAGVARLVPSDPTAIGDALVELLTDAGRRRALVAAGIPWLARHSWSRSAAIIRGVLARVCAG